MNKRQDISVCWQKFEIVGGLLLSLIGLLILLLIHCQQKDTSLQIAKTAREMENFQIEISNKITSGQLAGSLLDSLLRGTQSEKLSAMIILENSTPLEFTEIVLAAVAVSDEDESIRTKAINILKMKGKSTFSQQILAKIRDQGRTTTEREVAEQAHKAVKKRIETELSKSLKLARLYYENNLMESAASEFNKVVHFLTPHKNVDQAFLTMANNSYLLKDYKRAADYYIKAAKNIVSNKNKGGMQ